MAAQHTPTPWQLDPDDEYAIQNVEGGMEIATVSQPDLFPCRDEDDDEDFEDECTANAAFIVRACNVHDELVAALKWFIDDIDGTNTVMVDFGRNVERARAALAQAKVA